MGKISVNGGVYMTIITSDMIISKKKNKYIVTYDTELNSLDFIWQSKARLN